MRVHDIPEVSISLHRIRVQDLSDLVHVLLGERDLATLKVFESPLFATPPQNHVSTNGSPHVVKHGELTWIRGGE